MNTYEEIGSREMIFQKAEGMWELALKPVFPSFVPGWEVEQKVTCFKLALCAPALGRTVNGLLLSEVKTLVNGFIFIFIFFENS